MNWGWKPKGIGGGWKPKGMDGRSIWGIIGGAFRAKSKLALKLALARARAASLATSSVFPVALHRWNIAERWVNPAEGNVRARGRALNSVAGEKRTSGQPCRFEIRKPK